MARQKILGISLDENGIGYLPQSYFYVNCKSGTWRISLVDPKPTRKIMSKNPLTVILDNNKFNGTNYTDWLRTLRIVLDYENQWCIMDKLLPQTLPDGSSSEERETFERWHADHRIVQSIILASMSNDVQKQYDRLDDVASILQRMKEVYVIPDRHTRVSIQEHGVKMLSLVEKLEDLKAELENDTYIDVILQSLPPSYDPFIVNFNMNGLEKSINELINMLVQYEVTIKKSVLSVLIGEASTSKAKGKRAERCKRKKGKAKAKTVVVAKDAKSAPVAPVGMGKGKKMMGMFVVEVNMVTDSASWVLDTGCGAHICNDLQVLQRNRKLSKDEVVVRLGDGNAVAAKAVGIINLIKDGSSHLLGHISQDRMKRLVDSKSLEMDNLDNLPACESCLKGKMTKKPFVGQSKLVNGLLDLIHTDVCGPLHTQARGGFSYFITFTDDHSRYGYVYLMRYKSEAFVRFKEFRLEIENQTGRKIKTLRSDRGGEYLSGEFIDYLKENGIVSQWTPPETP
ncbi:UNVERIFIED_CONTAM: Retrovirus-related Pol polyprotein from transposon TNT 1-94 [Sesamum calycinum]|uniref:Retrovirus-related Pol polyprotein from transposon TNT 1-94 n=1 Tax=Sesamum calycinum TaxID=2727403 RepID=A0AAW2KG60_9LAMI